MTSQLTFDGTEVPHAKVAKGPSDSRVLRRPEDLVGALLSTDVDGQGEVAFARRLEAVLDRAKIAPGDAFYVSRIPKALPPEPRKSRGAPKGFPRRGRRLDVLEAVAGNEGITRARLAWRIVDGRDVKGLADVDRRVRELLEAGFLRQDDRWLFTTDKARRGLAEAERRAQAEGASDDHRDGEGTEGDQEAVERGHAHDGRPAGAES